MARIPEGETLEIPAEAETAGRGRTRVHVLRAQDGRLLCVPAPGARPPVVNDVQVSGSAELRPGDVLRCGALTVFVQKSTSITRTDGPVIWPHAVMEQRISQELRRAQAGGSPVAVFVVHAPRLRFVDDQATPPWARADGLEWSQLGVVTWLGLAATGDVHEHRRSLEATLSQWPGARLGWAVAPEDGVEPGEVVSVAVARVLGMEAELATRDEWVVADAAMLQLRALLESLAGSARSLAISGEPGTGRANWAHRFHAMTRDASRRCAVVDCRDPRVHAWEPEVSAGTLVMLNLDALPVREQVVLTARWSGDSATRLVATSSSELDPRLRETFEAEVWIPSLRDRRGEIVPIATQLLHQLRARVGRPHLTLNAEVRATLEEYAWPGNIRELKTVMSIAALIAESDEVRLENLPERVAQAWQTARRIEGDDDLRSSLKAVEKDTLLKVLARTQWNVTAAARELGLPRRTIVYRMSRLGLRRPGR